MGKRDSETVPFFVEVYALIAQRNLAERARLLIWHSSDDARIGSGAIS